MWPPSSPDLNPLTDSAECSIRKETNQGPIYEGHIQGYHHEPHPGHAFASIYLLYIETENSFIEQ